MDRAYLDEAALLLLAAPLTLSEPWRRLLRPLLSTQQTALVSSTEALGTVCRYFARRANQSALRKFLRDIELVLDEVYVVRPAQLMRSVELMERFALPHGQALQVSLLLEEGIEQLVSPYESYDTVPGITRISAL